MGTVAAAFSTVEKTDWHKEVLPIVEPAIDDMVSTYLEKMDVDGKDAYAEDKRRENTLVGCIEALEKSFTAPASMSSSELQERLDTVLTLIQKVSAVRLRGIELSIFASLESLFTKLDSTAAAKLEGSGLEPVAELTSKLFFQYDANAYMQSVRLARAKALVAFGSVQSAALVGAVIKPDVLNAEITKEPEQTVKDTLQQIPRK